MTGADRVSLAKLRYPLFGLYVVGCFALGTGPLWLGPSEWDDMQYLECAQTGQSTWYLRNRYVHIWALRLASGLVEPRALAAGLYSTGLVAGLGLVGYALARRAAGPLAGLAALVLVPLYPSVLRYFSTPHVDLTLAFWSLLALLCTTFALESPRPRARLAWAALAGAAGLFALESKEPGMVVAPLVLYGLARQPAAARKAALGAWAGGTGLGLLLLFALDAAFIREGGFFPSNPLEYLGQAPASAVATLASGEAPAATARKALRLREDYLSQLAAPAFLPFTLLGFAGAVRAFERSVAVQLLTAFALGSLLFGALVASYVPELHANDRYVLSAGVALATLTAVWAAELWGEARKRAAADWLSPVVLGALALALWASLRALSTELPAAQATRFFFGPIAVVTALFALGVGLRRASARAALVGLLLLAALDSVHGARDHVSARRAELQPWRDFVRDADAQAIVVRTWRTSPHYPQDRVRRRLRALSSRPIAQLSPRPLSAPEQLGPGEWLFTAGARSPALEALGLSRVHHGELGKRSWSVYAR